MKKLSTFVHDVYESYQENYKLWLVRARNYQKYKQHYDKVTVCETYLRKNISVFQ